MTKEILLVAEAVSNEKGVSEDIIFEAIELALATATKKRYDEDADIEVTIDRETGEYETVRRWLVVPDEEMALLGTQFTTEEAIDADAALKPGDIHQEAVENVGFGRIAAQTAKQVIVQRVRDAERAQVVEQYMDRVGDLVAGTVKKVTRDNVIVDLGNNAEGLLPREQLVGRETFRVNDRSVQCHCHWHCHGLLLHGCSAHVHGGRVFHLGSLQRRSSLTALIFSRLRHCHLRHMLLLHRASQLLQGQIWRIVQFSHHTKELVPQHRMVRLVRSRPTVAALITDDGPKVNLLRRFVSLPTLLKLGVFQPNVPIPPGDGAPDGSLEGVSRCFHLQQEQQ